MRDPYDLLPLPISLGRRIVLPFLLHLVLLANTPLATCRSSYQFVGDSTSSIGVRYVSHYLDSIRPFSGVKSPSVVKTVGQPLATVDGSSQCPPYGDRVSVVSTKLRDVSEVLLIGVGLKEITQLQRTCFHVQARGGVNRTRSLDDGCAQKTHFRFIIISSPLPPTRMIRAAAQIEYMPNSSSHKVCYTLSEPGPYRGSLFLDFTNVDVLTSRDPECCTPLAGRSHSFLVTEMDIQVWPSAQPRKASPPCSPPLLSGSSNEGRWVADEWEPMTCRPQRVEPPDLITCLNQKSILVIGDSQMRYVASELMALMGGGDRARYTAALKKSDKQVSQIKTQASPIRWKLIPQLPVSVARVRGVTKWGNRNVMHFYGSFWEGFGHFSGRHVSRRHFSFNLTYVCHMYAFDPLFADWMLNDAFLGPNVVTRDGPFHLILTSLGLHDVAKETPQEFEDALRSRYIPALNTLVRDPQAITFTSMWSFQDKRKPGRYVAKSNNARAQVYDKIMKRVVSEEGIMSWLNLREMTASRPDLCTDSTHYKWPVSMAMLDLWLGGHCPLTKS